MTAGSADRRPLRVALIGYGRMGRAVDELAAGRGVRVALRLRGADVAAGAGLTAEALAGVDVAIDFSTADALLGGNLERLCALGVDAVVGTTGWEAERRRVRELVAGAGVGVVFGANFSLGANAFLEAAAAVAARMARLRGYDLSLFESHHRSKRDAPSGTALRLTRRLESEGHRFADATSQRTGFGIGTHELAWDSSEDAVTLRHAARSRAGFARGALAAAHWVRGRKGLYDFAEHWKEVAQGATGSPVAPGQAPWRPEAAQGPWS